MKLNYQPFEEEDVFIATEEKKDNHIVLYNDDVNTFDWVIDSLISVCNHERNQAEQCSYIVHYNGRCSVKDGNFKELQPMCEALLERGLSAIIE